jgi:hypothetical protein
MANAKEYAEFLRGLASSISLDKHAVIYESTVFNLLAKIDRAFSDVLRPNMGVRIIRNLGYSPLL